MLDDKFYLYGDIFLTLYKLDRIKSYLDNNKIPKGLITDKQKNVIHNVIKNTHKVIYPNNENSKILHAAIYKEFNGSISNDNNNNVNSLPLQEQFNFIDDNKLSEKILFTFFDKNLVISQYLKDMLDIQDTNEYDNTINELKKYGSNETNGLEELDI